MQLVCDALAFGLLGTDDLMEQFGQHLLVYLRRSCRSAVAIESPNCWAMLGHGAGSDEARR